MATIALLHVLLLFPTPASGPGPGNVFLLVNKNVRASREVAEHYCNRRGVPQDHLIELDLPAGEDISRNDYNAKLVAPVRAALRDRRDLAKILVATYGVPLRVGNEEPSAAEKKELTELQPQLGKVEGEQKSVRDAIAKLEAEAKSKPSDELTRQLNLRRADLNAIEQQLRRFQNRQKHLSHAESLACVDSELALLWWDGYELRRWQPNLLNFQVPVEERRGKPPILMVSRLDGPTPAIAKRLIDDAIEVEQKGLEGKVYVDARGIGFEVGKLDSGFGYGGYDESLREMARLLGKNGGLAVTLDDKPELFASGACLECALYCGWYSLGKYVDCCRFVKGAVAYHIASSEAVSLRDVNCKYWCKCLLEDGVVATLGPVAEPYTVGFPKPAEFFGMLVTGRYVLVECYAKTALLNSWMTVLVGDPLYNPYRMHPRLRVDQVKPSPAGGQPLWTVNHH